MSRSSTPRQRNTLDFHLHPLGQLMYGHTTPRRLRRPIDAKMLFVLPVHLGEILHVGEEDSGFDDAADVGAGGGEDGFEVCDAEGGFVAH